MTKLQSLKLMQGYDIVNLRELFKSIKAAQEIEKDTLIMTMMTQQMWTIEKMLISKGANVNE